MEAHVEYFEPPVQPALFRATLGFRRRLERTDEFWLDMFISTVREWVRFRDWTLESWTTGIHLNASYPHVHFHMVIWTTKLLSNPLSTFKYDTIHGRYALFQMTNDPTPFEVKDIIGENRYTSIQMRVLPSHDDEVAFLQYPLKEANEPTIKWLHNSLYNHLKDMDIDTMLQNSKKIYLSSCKKHETKEKVQLRKQTDWELLCEICDDVPRYFDQIVHHVLRYYQANVEHPPHPQILVKRAEKYCFKKGIIPVETIAITYSQFLGLPPM